MHRSYTTQINFRTIEVKVISAYILSTPHLTVILVNIVQGYRISQVLSFVITGRAQGSQQVTRVAHTSDAFTLM